VPRVRAGGGLRGLPGAAGQAKPILREAGPDRARPEAQSAARLSRFRSPSGVGRVSQAIWPFWPQKITNAPEYGAASAEVFTGCHHCVIAISLTVSDAGGLGKGYRAESPNKLTRVPVRFGGSGLCPLCWGSPRRADTVTTAKAIEAPIV
jgi:hypothetical protein